MPDLKELKELLKVLRANGVTSYHSGEVKLDLLPDYKKAKSNQPDMVNEPAPDNKAYTDEELLFWSSAGLEDISPKEE